MTALLSSIFAYVSAGALSISRSLAQWGTSTPEQNVSVLLKPNSGRFSLFPIKFPEVWKAYKVAQSLAWTAEEVDLGDDRKDWQTKLTDNERYFVKHVLAFFAASDGIVLENLQSQLAVKVQIPEARAFYAFQMAIETVHAEVYGLLIDTYITDPQEKQDLFEAATGDKYPAVKQKADWAVRWTESTTASYPQQLLAFAIVEGVFFCGSFCAVFWLKQRNVLHGLGFSNELIARDESLHCDFACLLYSMLSPEERLSEKEVHEIMKSAVDIESKFITEALQVSLIGMNADLMLEYIQFVADRLLVALKYTKLWNIPTNPFPFMEQLSLDGKTNFFEKRVGEYAKAGFSEAATAERNTAFSSEGDF